MTSVLASPQAARRRSGEAATELSLSPDADGVFDIVSVLLREQQSLTAVEAFSREHERWTDADEPDQAVYYRRLMPATPPGERQQYAFEVDLDSCSGCKACVVACHTLNGLDESESWRRVGTFTIGETDDDPSDSNAPADAWVSGVQHVTTACHHCEDPGCLNGCPVKAYVKDPVTGIVRHLDDQCIGCKYCTMMCPYEVPKYSKRLGIVRKCDMCHQRLGAGEAPACVQSCPNEAIAIRTVSSGQEFTINDRLVAGAPVSSITRPTTKYIQRRGESSSIAIAQDHGIDQVAESHWPLAVMLVATQISVAMVLCERVTAMALTLAAEPIAMETTRTIATTAWIVAMIGLNIAPLHLGQPMRAWRVFLGLRTSWLSREAVLLGKYVGALTAAVGLLWYPAVAPIATTYLPVAISERIPMWFRIPDWSVDALLGAAVLFGVVGLYSSAMIYIATKRALWRPNRTLPRFLGTGLIVGSAMIAICIVGSRPTQQDAEFIASIWLLVAAMTASLKLIWESRLSSAAEPSNGSVGSLDRRSHRLMTNELKVIRRARFSTGWTGAVSCLVAMAILTTGSLPWAWAALGTATILLLVGESLERLLYFMSVVYDRMPGTLR